MNRARGWRSGSTREWRRLRAAHLRREPNCRRCGAPAVTADHITPLADGGALDGELQSLCKPHAEDKDMEDRAKRTGKPVHRRKDRVKGVDPATGMPIDPEHPWNKPSSPDLPKLLDENADGDAEGLFEDTHNPWRRDTYERDT